MKKFSELYSNVLEDYFVESLKFGISVEEHMNYTRTKDATVSCFAANTLQNLL